MFGWWGNKAKTEFESKDYKPGKDTVKRIRELQAAEKKRIEKWKKELKKMAIDPRSYNVGDVWSDPYNSTTSVYTSNNTWTSIDTSTKVSTPVLTTHDTAVSIDGTLQVNGRDITKELDEMREALLLLKRDVNLEEKYPELKEAYDNYMDLYRGLRVADKLTNSGLE